MRWRTRLKGRYPAAALDLTGGRGRHDLGLGVVVVTDARH
jgi:hypothetical protein